MKINEKISTILGYRIPPGKWELYLQDMDKEGEPTRKHMGEMIFALCEEVERLRKDIDIIYIKEKYAETDEKRRTEESI